MIIPIKCFTCGKLIADKYLYYQSEVRKIKLSSGVDEERVVYLEEDNFKKTPEGKVLDKIKLTKMCCRRHMLTHVDIE